MQRISKYLATLYLCISISGCASFFPREETETATLTILHWNDVHSWNLPYEVNTTDPITHEKMTYSVGGVGNLLAYLDASGRGKANVAVLNAGDEFLGTPVSSMTMGRSQIELMNIISPDAMVLGNHEFDYGLPALQENISLATFPIITANLWYDEKARLFVPPTLVKQFGPVKLGIIGLTHPDLPTLTLKETINGTTMLPIDSVVAYHTRSLRQNDNVDLVVVLSHIGLHEDTLLAMRHDGIDIIIGGHTHLPLLTPIKKNRTIICQAGSRGRYVGRLDVLVDLQGDSVLRYEGRLIETKLGIYPPHGTAQQKALEFEALVDRELNEVIGTLTVTWQRSFNSESNIGNWQADVMREFAKADIALMNSGGIRKDKLPGPLTKRDVWEINPFGNTFVTFNIPGSALLNMLEWQAAGKGEFMQVSGLRYVFDPDRPYGEKVLESAVGGTPVQPDSMYSIVTNNYVAGQLPELLGLDLRDATSLNMKDLRVVDRDVFIRHIQLKKAISSTVEGRIINIRSSMSRQKHQ